MRFARGTKIEKSQTIHDEVIFERSLARKKTFNEKTFILKEC